jgi:NitT/TauT family transport system substrate-binding protein
VITFKESNIRGFADLKGKSISTSVASPEGIMLKARLKEVGLDAERDVRILNVAPGAKLTMQLNGQADTSTGFVNFQLIQAELAGRNVAFLPFSTPAEPLYGHAVFANATWLDRNPDDAKRFVAATVKGIAWARDNVDKAVDLVVTWDTSLNIDRNFIKRDWEAHLAQLMGSDLTARSGIGHMEQAGWANLARLLSEGGVVTGQVDPAAIFTNAFIPSDAPKWK